jgi:hypothetical protein
MKSVKHVKAEDVIEPTVAKTDDRAFDLYGLLGTWVNTNDATRGITRVILATRDNKLIVRIFEACDPSSRDWGEVEAESVYASGISSLLASAFSARYRFDFSETHLLANTSLGLLIIASVSTFKDGSGRSKYFSREFFRRQAREEAEG